MVRPMYSMSMGPLPHFFYTEVSPLIRNSAVWNTMTMDKAKAFYKSTDGSFGRSIACREGKSIKI